MSTQSAGLLLTPFPLAIAVIGPLSGSLADRFGSRMLTGAGLAVSCFGLVLLSRLGAANPTWDVAWRLAVVGAGQGLFMSPNTRALTGAAPKGQLGTASSLQATGRVVGQSVSVALAGAVFASLGGALAGSGLSAAHASGAPISAGDALTFLSAFRAALLVSAGLAALGVVTSLLRPSENVRGNLEPGETSLQPQFCVPAQKGSSF